MTAQQGKVGLVRRSRSPQCLGWYMTTFTLTVGSDPPVEPSQPASCLPSAVTHPEAALLLLLLLLARWLGAVAIAAA